MTIETLILSAAMAAAAGLVGCFAVMRRMALAGDALSHVALPGIGIALALHVHPVFGATAMLFFGALIVWAIEDRSRLATETIIGVIFLRRSPSAVWPRQARISLKRCLAAPGRHRRAWRPSSSWSRPSE